MITEDRLRELYGPPTRRSTGKETDYLDVHARAFLAAAPFMVLATSDGHRLDVSPKGDPRGFVQVEDDKHLIVPDRPGNNRIDGLMNIVRHPMVAMIFLIPTVEETMRINGRAEITEDEELRARCAIKGRLPKTVMRVEVEEVFIHCGKAPLRAGLWKPETWDSERPVATLFEIVRDQGKIDVESTEQDYVDDLYRKTLY